MNKKGKLYTVNRWNAPSFTGASNLFDIGGDIAKWDRLASKAYGANYGDAGFTLNDYMSHKNAFGISRQDNPFSKGNLAGTGKMALGAAAGAVGSIGEKAISGGLHSSAGDAIGTIGSTVGGLVGTVNPVAGAIVGGGSQLLKGVANRLVGSKFNQNHINAVNQNISNLRASGNVLGGVSSNEELLKAWGDTDMGFNFDDSYIGEDGLFSNKARNKARALRRSQESARNYAIHALATGAINADNLMDDSIMANFSAFGGPINTNDMGAIEYGFISDFLTNKKKKTEQDNQLTSMFAGVPNGMFSFGGDMQSNGGDFSTGLTHVDAGNSHSENPYGGVQMGVDNENTPNLVEEGETIFDDYVYSNRILADAATKQFFKLPRKSKLTYADISRKLEREVSERPNDPISRASFEAQMHQLAEQQERQKAEMETEKARAAFEALSPEEQTALMREVSARENLAAQTAQQEALAAQQMAMAAPEQAPMQQQGMSQPELVQEQQPVMSEGGTIVKKSNGQTDFEQSVFPLQEVTIVGNKRQEVPNTAATILNGLQALKQQEAIQEIADNLAEMKALEDEKKRKNRIHYYAKGGDKENEDYDTWYSGLDPYYQWFSKLYDIRNSESLDAYDDSFKYNLNGLYGLLQNEENNKLALEALYGNNRSFSPDIYNAFLINNLTGNTASSLTPEQWRQVYNSFMEEKNAFEKEHPYIPYNQRMEDNYRRRWDRDYEGYSPDGEEEEEVVVPKATIKPNIVKNDEGLIDYDKSSFDVPEVVVAGRRVPPPQSANERGVAFTPDALPAQATAQASEITPERRRPAGVTPDVLPSQAVQEQPFTAVETPNEDIFPPIYAKRVPRHRAEWPRYAGLFGPVVGLGMMAAGVGKPDYSSLDAALEGAGDVVTADYKPLGNYLTYRPMDIWYGQNKLDANTRATDRSILNSGAVQGNKIAGLLASGYNSQIASGDLYRKALEYNDAKKAQVAEFNRGTDQFNADAYNRLSQFNASARNQANQHRGSLALQAAKERMDADAGWYNSLYGNVSNLFKGLSDLGRENAMWNMVADLGADSVFGVLGNSNTGKRILKSSGGKIKRGKRGMTF